jgi:DNA-binding GntR family transcriptional regulator
MAATLAVPVLSEDDLEEMRSAIAHATLAITRGQWRELSHWNRTFHGTLIRRCQNRRLRRVLETLQDQNRIIALLTWEGRGYDEQEHDEHTLILEAASRREPHLAAAHLRHHIARFGRDVVRIWEDRATHAVQEATASATPIATLTHPEREGVRG